MAKSEEYHESFKFINLWEFVKHVGTRDQKLDDKHFYRRQMRVVMNCSEAMQVSEIRLVLK